MKVLILLSVVVTAFASQECGENEHWESCGTACPLTCDNYKNPPRVCVLRCDIGCHCDKGYVRSSDGRCVRPEDCPAKSDDICGENQRYSECGSPCPLTCENYDNPPLICPAMCVMGCECKKGFVKTKDGRCVRPEECPNRSTSIPEVCGDNERFSTCGSACPLTCENYDNPPEMCPLMCIFGCECEKGFVKSKDGRCVRPEDCSNEFRSFGGRKTSVSDCDLPSEAGVCRGFFPKYYFDRTTGKCEQFIYGGCGGNGNNFESEKECLETCASAAPSACRQQKVVGRCDASFVRYFYNTETNKCEEFIYGGCEGNSNNFNTLEDCEAVCSD